MIVVQAQNANTFAEIAAELLKRSSDGTLSNAFDLAVQIVGASNIKRPKEAENGKRFDSPEGYDLVIDIPSIQSIRHGWCINFTGIDPTGSIFLSGPDFIAFRKVVAVVGYYSKGKSFMVNRLFNSIQKKMSNTFNDIIFSTKNSMNLEQGPGVTTRGLSAIVAGYDKSYNDANILIFDCAGRNSPGVIDLKESRYCKNEIGQCQNESQMDILKDSISDMRAKERLIDDVVMQEADCIVYVVDELLNEDQRVILNVIEKMKGSPTKQLYLIHNYKRLDYSDPQVPSYIEEQIVKPFGAKRMTESKYHGLLAKDVRGYYFPKALYVSEWPASGKFVYHFAIFNDNVAQNKIHNAALFAYISAELFKPDVNFVARKSSILDRLALSIELLLPQLITVNATSAAVQQGIQVYPQNKCDALLKPNKFESKQLKVRPWDLVVRAPGTSFGTYVPKTNSFSGTDETGIQFYQIRVDLPGVGLAAAKNTPPPPHTSYLMVSKTHSDDDKNHFKVIINGTRFNDIDDSDVSSFGDFNVVFIIEQFYNKKGPLKLSNGQLSIRFFHFDDEDDEWAPSSR